MRKQKLYAVPVISIVNATRLVRATSKKEAFEIADREIKESLDRLIDEAVPHPDIEDLRGNAQATAYMIQIRKEE